MNRRSFLFGGLAGLLVAPIAVKETLVDAVEVAADYISSVAEAGEKKVYTDIGEYYDSGVVVDVMPGARRCPMAEISDKALGFVGSEWYDLYFGSEYGAILQNIFKSLDNELVTINSPEHLGESVRFDFEQFHNFNKNNKGDNTVSLWRDGFMSFGNDDVNLYERILIPIPTYIITQIEKL